MVCNSLSNIILHLSLGTRVTTEEVILLDQIKIKGQSEREPSTLIRALINLYKN